MRLEYFKWLGWLGLAIGIRFENETDDLVTHQRRVNVYITIICVNIGFSFPISKQIPIAKDFPPKDGAGGNMPDHLVKREKAYEDWVNEVDAPVNVIASLDAVDDEDDW